MIQAASNLRAALAWHDVTDCISPCVSPISKRTDGALVPYRYRYVTPVSFYRNVDPSLVETNLDGIPAN